MPGLAVYSLSVRLAGCASLSLTNSQYSFKPGVRHDLVEVGSG